MTVSSDANHDNTQLFLRILHEACNAATSDDTSQPEPAFSPQAFAAEFFRKWYHEPHYPYLFLFHKNRQVTDISYSELTALLRIYATFTITPDDTTPPEAPAIPPPRRVKKTEIQFESSKTFKDALASLWCSFGRPMSTGDSYDDKKQSLIHYLDVTCSTFADLYYDLCANLILYDAYYGSALIHVPRTLTLDALSLCAQAGYIRCCGPAIYFRNTKKARLSPFIENLRTYVAGRASNRKKLYLLPYSHERFDQHDRAMDFNKMLPHGLDELKLYLDRFHIENYLMVDVLGHIRRNAYLKDMVFIPDGTPSLLPEAERTQAIKNDNVDPSVTLFLLAERSINEGRNHFPGDEQYFICFAQEAVNSSPLIAFNEAKPGWMAPVTIPHTLAGAMLNISRPWLPKHPRRPLTIIDPFCGTGTFLLESLKIPTPVRFIACDEKCLSPIVVSDNIEFFSKDHEWLNALLLALREFIAGKSIDSSLPHYADMPTSLDSDGNLKKNIINDIVRWSVATIHAEMATISYQPSGYKTDDALPPLKAYRKLFDWDFTQNFIRTFRHGNEYFVSRLLFYVVWKACVDNVIRIVNNWQINSEAILEEFKHFVGRLEELQRIRDINRAEEMQYKYEYRDNGRVCMQDGVFSREAIIPYLQFQKVRAAGEKRVTLHDLKGDDDEWYYWHECHDALHTLGEFDHNVDLIVTDPPYGFNTDPNDLHEFARFYNKMIKAMVRALRPDGQLVLCVPQHSRTGQVVPFFVTKNMVTRQILHHAEDDDKQVVQESRMKPFPVDCFVPPYYWHAEKALTRAILHFRFMQRV